MTPARYTLELESLPGGNLAPVAVRLRAALRTLRRRYALRAVVVAPRPSPAETEPKPGATGAQTGREKRNGRLEI